MTEPLRPLKDERNGPPSPLRILPILLIVPPVAWVAREVGGAVRVDWTRWTLFVVGSAGLIGMPALFWALDHARTRVWQLVLLGACAGLLPMSAVVASGALGRFIRGGWPYVRRTMAAGAPIPTYGYLSWEMLIQTEIYAAIIGAGSAAIYWALFVLPGTRRV